MIEMREDLKRLCNKLKRLEVGYTADAICDLRDVLYELIVFVERTTPEEQDDR